MSAFAPTLETIRKMIALPRGKSATEIKKFTSPCLIVESLAGRLPSSLKKRDIVEGGDAA